MATLTRSSLVRDLKHLMFDYYALVSLTQYAFLSFH